MSKADDDLLKEYGTTLFNEMIEDVVTDVVLNSHREMMKNRNTCTICLIPCHQIHLPLSARTTGLSRAASPALGDPSRSTSANSLSGATTPNPGTKSDGNLYFECLNCGRSFASIRYAPHLSNCLGIGSSRRNTSRSGTVKPKSTPDFRRSTTPSERGGSHPSEDGSPNKMRTEKSPSKDNDEDESNPASNATGEDATRAPELRKRKQEAGRAIPSPYHSKVPSRLRETAFNSSPDGSPASSRASSPITRLQDPVLIDSLVPVEEIDSPTKRPRLSQDHTSGDQGKLLPISVSALRQRVNNSSVDYILDGDEISDSSSSDES